MDYLKIITAIFIWSSLGIFIRKIDLPNEGIIFYTAVIAGTLQFILLLSSGLLRTLRDSAANIRSNLLLIISPVCFLANTMLFYYAFRHTTIANAVLTHYTAPVFVAILAPLLLKENIRRTTWIAIILSSLGLWFIFSGTPAGTEVSHGSREGLGIMAGALSGLAYAFLILIVRKIASLYPSLLIIFIQNGIVAILLLPFVFNMEVPLQAWPYLVTMGILHSTVAPLLYVQGFKSVTANEAAILGYFEPVGAIVLALVFLHELPGLIALTGGILILYSGYMILAFRGGGSTG